LGFNSEELNPWLLMVNCKQSKGMEKSDSNVVLQTNSRTTVYAGLY